MKFKIILFICSVLITKCYSDNLGSCSIENITFSEGIFRTSMKDTEKLDLKFDFTGSLTITDVTDTEYFELKIDGQQIILKTTDKFSNLDADTPKQSTGDISLPVKGVFHCEDVPKPMTFAITVTDTNNNPPTFPSATYTYTMPMPLPPHIDLTLFGDKIIATDLDFSNQDITFTGDYKQDLFQLETIDNGDKTYQAVLTVSSYTTFSKSFSFTITATDSGDPTKSATTTVKINVDESSSLPNVPSFSKPSYRFQYSTKPNPTITGDEIKIIPSNPDDAANVEVTIDPIDYFTAKYEPSTEIVTIGLSDKLLDVTTESVLIYTLTATITGSKDSSKSVIVVDIPKDNVISVPRFTKPFYTATYTTNPDAVKLDPDNEIAVTDSVENVDIALAGDKHFSINKNSENNKWELTLSQKLDEATLKEGGDIVLSIEATATGPGSENLDKGYSTLMITLPEVIPIEAPKFSQNYYTAKYVVKDGDTLDTVELTKGNIEATSEGQIVDITFVESDDEYFTIAKESDVWKVSVKKDLSKERLEEGGDYILTLQAAITGEDADEVDKTYASLVITVPTPEVPPVPKFSEIYYTGIYTVSETETDLDTVVMSEEIKLSGSQNQDVEVTFVKSDEYFEIKKESEVWKLSVKKDLPKEIIEAGDDYILKLQAAVTGDDANKVDKGYASLIITMPTPEVIPVPKFSEIYYTGTYTVIETGVDTVVISGNQIEISSPQDQDVKVTIKGTSENFDIQEDPENSNTYKIIVLNDLTEDDLKKGEDIILNLEANIPDVGSGTCTVVITLPKITIPQFDKLYYYTNYEIVGSADKLDTLDFLGPIKITSPDPKTVDVNFDASNKYLDYFEIAKDSDNNWNLKVIKDLEEETLKGGEDIVIVLQASIQNDPLKSIGSSAVIIHLPEIKVPKFLQPLYNAEYKVSDDNKATVTINDGPVQFTPSDATATIAVIGTYKDNFIFDINGKPQITVTKNLLDDLIKTEKDIPITLEASIQESDRTETTVIVLKLPYVETPKTLKFEKPSYVYKYIVDGDKHSLEGDVINIINGDSNVGVTISDGTYAKNFKIQNDGNGHKITINQNLGQEVLNTEIDIILTVTASLEGDDDGFATILINLPKKELKEPPQFIKSSFLANYLVQTDKLDTVEMTDENAIQLQDGIVGTPEVSIITGTYSTNFELTPDEKTKSYTVTVIKDLDENILIKEVDIVLTLEARLADASDVGLSSLVIKLPKKVAPPAFNKPYFSGSYKIESAEKHSIEISDSITLVGDNIKETKVELTGDFKDNFNFHQDQTTGSCTIDLKEPLKDDTLNTEHEIILTLVASLTDSTLSTLTTSATIVISLPEVPTAPKFSSILYVAQYEVVDGTPTVSLNDNQKITTDPDVPNSVKLDSYQDNFILQYNKETKEYELSAGAILNQDIIDRESEINIKLVATVDRALEPSYANLQIKMPQSKTNVVPTFSATYYEGTYKVDGDVHSVEIAAKRPIQITSDHSSETQVKIIETYAENFKAELQDGSWQLSVLKQLDPDTLKSAKEIRVSLEASIPGNKEVGVAVLILNLPTQDLKPAPKFSEKYYTAEYTINEDGSPTINMITEPIAIEGADQDLVNVVLDTYDTNFKITYDSKNKKWDISIGTPFEEPFLRENTEISVILSAKLDGSVGDGTATLIVSLPKLSVIAFKNSYYAATYIDNIGKKDTLDSDEITVTDVDAEVNIIDPSDYSSKFDLTCKAGKCQLTLKEDLSDETLKSKMEIVLVLEVSKKDVTDKRTAIVIVNLPLQKSSKIPQFTANVYTATYVVIQDKPDTVTIKNGPIQVAGQTDVTNIPVQILGENHDSFDLTRKGDHWDLTVTKDLDEDILKNDISILLVIEVEVDNVKGETGLVIELPKKVVPSSIEFSSNTYMATYVDNDKDKDVVEIPEKIIIGGDGASTAKVELSGDYAGNFDITYDPKTGEVTITLKEDFPSEVIHNEPIASVDIVATKGDDTAKATLVIEIPKETKPSIEFSENAYMASYIYADPDNIQIDGDITITGDGAKEAEVVPSGDYADYFTVNYDKENMKVEITLKQELASDILSKEVAISIDLVATSGKDTAKAILLIKLPKQTTTPSILFSENAYMASYIDADPDNIQIDSDITITGPGAEAAKVVPSGDYAEYFNVQATKNEEDIKVEITLKKELTSDILNKEVAISIDLVATSGKDTTTATLVIKLPKQTTTQSIQFSENAYMATYIDADPDNIQIDGDITITGPGAEAAKVVPSGDNAEYFNVQATKNEDDIKVEITLKKDLTSDILNKEVAISIDLVATSGKDKAIATLVIKLPKQTTTQSIQFSENAYMATYIDADPDKIQIDGDITITGDGIKSATVEPAGDNAEYFNVQATKNEEDIKVEITLKKDLTSDILSNEAAISIDLVATSGKDTAKATLVIKLPKQTTTQSIQFSENAYMASYIDADHDSIKIDGDITITGDGAEAATVVPSGDYAGYFNVNYDNKNMKVQITLPKDLPNDILNKQAAISFDLVATSGKDTAKATLVIKLPKQTTTQSIQFSENAYMASYIDADHDSIKIDGDITITGDGAEAATVVPSGDYAGYFNVNYDNKNMKVQITLPKDLPNDILNKQAAISFDLVATSGKDTAKATLVIKLPKQTTTQSIQFSENAYMASYIDADHDSIKIDGDITITGDGVEAATVVPYGDYAGYFNVNYDNKTMKVQITLPKDLPNDILNKQAAISFDLVATSGKDKARATLVIKLPKIIPTSITFSDTVYLADYIIDGDSAKIELETDMSLKGDVDDTISVSVLPKEYAQYFKGEYKGGKIIITKEQDLPADIVNNSTALPLEITASKGDETIKAKLILKLPKVEIPDNHKSDDGDDDDSQAGFIAAVSVLAVLLVCALVGSAVFYYLKFKRGSPYRNMDEPKISEHFRQNPSHNPGNRFSHPTRRATGLIKMPLPDDIGETTTDEEIPDKRKSVQFDVENIDELEIEPEVPDDNENNYEELDKNYHYDKEENSTQL